MKTTFKTLLIASALILPAGAYAAYDGGMDKKMDGGQGMMMQGGMMGMDGKSGTGQKQHHPKQ